MNVPVSLLLNFLKIALTSGARIAVPLINVIGITLILLMQWNNVSKACKTLLFIACGICIGIAANWNDEASVGFKSGIDAYSFPNGDESDNLKEKEDSNKKSESSK